MPLDDLPGRIITFTRDEIRARYLRSYSLRNPNALTDEGTQPFVDASSFADASLPLYANAVALGAAISRTSATGRALDDEARFLGTSRLPAAGAVGFVRVTTSLGGGQILAGDELRAGSLRYRCIATAVYVDGAFVPVAGLDTGPATNQAPGTALTWSRPRPGIGPSAIVVRQGNGTGLAGGREVESDGELQKRLISLRANPPASGNDAQYQLAVLDTPGVPVEQAFTYPGILGPGTKGIVFTLRATALGESRIPNATHIAAVLAHIVGIMPADDSIFVGQLLAQPVDLALRVTWGLGVPGWVDLTPWPRASNLGVIVSPSPVATPTAFQLSGAGPPPTSGTTIALYDAPAARFQRKKIARVTGAGPWNIECETANRASDTTYAPKAMQPCCPWSDSLDALAAPVLAHFARLGPGEQRTTFFDPGLRQRRSPRSPQFWPSLLTNRLLSDVFNLPHVEDIALESPTVPLATTVGRRGVLSRLLTLGFLTAFPGP